MPILLLFATEEVDLLRVVSKLIIVALILMAVWVLFKLISYEWHDVLYNSELPSISEKSIDLQTYQSKEVEELKKKYDTMDQKPKLYFDPYSDHVYLCKNGEKPPIGDTKYLQ